MDLCRKRRARSARRPRPGAVVVAALLTLAASSVPAAQATLAAARVPAAQATLGWPYGSALGRTVHHPSLVWPTATPGPSGLSPAVVKSVYGFPTLATAGKGQTIAIVDAYDDPSIEADLGVFSRTYGLPACTTANRCFRKVDQRGTTRYPRRDTGWALEIALDVEWAHAIAPGAAILLVEANSNAYADILAAEDYATAHARFVSNSFGSDEFPAETGFDAHFRRPGVSIFVASGDRGAPPEYPSSSPSVISVGGTTLTGIGTPAFAETGWSGSGGGCSAYEAANPAQTAYPGFAQVNCGARRGTPDVALDANPASGVSVYDSYRGFAFGSNWLTVGGTSAATPMWAARAADSGKVVDAAFVYNTTPPLAITYRDITVGNNGLPALADYDLVTGRGSWTGATP